MAINTEVVQPKSREPVVLLEETHQYFVGEGLSQREAPSLSHVMKRAGFATDYSAVDPDHIEFKAAVGHCVHRAIYSFLSGYDEGTCLRDDDRFVELHAEINFSKFLAWVKGHDLEPWFMEKPSYNPDLGYACMADFVGLYDGYPWVIDWKTTYKIARSVAIQTIGQAACFDWSRVLDSGTMPMRGALHLPKRDTKAVELVPFTDEERDRRVLSAINVCERERRFYI